jgi:uncharacterized lipoprotein YajG
MKKILIVLSLFLIFSCASTEQTKTNAPKTNLENIGTALGNLKF